MSTKAVRRGKRHELYKQRRQMRWARARERRLMDHKISLTAAAVPIEDLPEIDAADAMQLLLNRVTFMFRAAAAEVDRLKPGIAKNQSDLEHELWQSWDGDGNIVVMANYWVAHEAKLREELLKLTDTAQRIGLSERRTRVAEAQIELMGKALQAACVAAGITDRQQRLLGSALREELAVLEGSA